MPATKREPTASQHWPQGLYHPRCVTGLSLLSVDPSATQRGSWQVGEEGAHGAGKPRGTPSPSVGEPARPGMGDILSVL